MTEPVIDGKYYQSVKQASVAERLLVRARDRIYDDFMRLCRPDGDTTILDVGVSDVINDGANVLERRYPYLSNVTAVGLGEGAEFRAAYPSVKYVRVTPNERLPFVDKAFDIATANAVLEHVGSQSNQEHFIAELARVAHTVFVSVPNRFFPIEHHTAIPLLHFWSGTFRLACRILNKDEWTLESNLILMSTDQLKALCGPDCTVGYTGLRLGALSSNIYAYMTR